jgi:D-glycero-alpha-D-manno-heptose-7-phosphate kinase
MVISRTPLRISFFGGGTDYPSYYHEHGGDVLSTTINQYLYLTVNRLHPFFDHKIHIGYSKSELINEVAEIQHPSARCCLNHLQITHGVEIFVMADLPARTGLGSSSTFTVGLLQGLHAFQHRLVSKDFLAREAIHIEQNVIGERVGSQDQVAAAFGGFNHLHFDRESTFRVDPLPFDPDRKRELNRHLMLFFTSISRSAHETVEEQCRKVQVNVPILQKMQLQVRQGMDILCDSRKDLREFGELLHDAWLLKRSLSSRISNSFIDDAYLRARQHGAIGGKLLGAGSGGFFLLFVPPKKQGELCAKIPELMPVPFEFEEEGTRLIHFSK